MLTAKQEKFIQNIVKGMSQREAYKNAYKAKYKDEAIDNKASALFNKGEVQVRYKELIDKATNKAIMSAQERKEWLTNILTGNTDDLDLTLANKLRAMDILNKMDGEYIDRLKVSNDEQKPFEVNIQVKE